MAMNTADPIKVAIMAKDQIVKKNIFFMSSDMDAPGVLLAKAALAWPNPIMTNDP